MSVTMCGECGGEMGEDVHRCPDAAGFDGSFGAALAAMKAGKKARLPEWDQWIVIRRPLGGGALDFFWEDGRLVSEWSNIQGDNLPFTSKELLSTDWEVADG
jgi:hypothetical protein